MDLGNQKLPMVLELFVFLLVVVSTISITYNQIETTDEKLHVSNISGTVKLSTEESMNALGLGEFRVGALATIDVDVEKVVSNGCETCISNPKGTQINGTVNITNLKDSESIGNIGSTGRVEGKLTITHLSEYTKSNFISREWISIDWDAGDSSINWELILKHNPPKWSPENRYSASFVDGVFGTESRSGPLVLVYPITNQLMKAQGCLPATYSCDEETTNINLNTSYKSSKESVLISHPAKWKSIVINSTSEEPPSKTQKVGNLFELGSETNDTDIYCPETNHQIISNKSWNVLDSGNNMIAPMNIWLEIFSLNSNMISAYNGEKWTEVDFDQSGCANLKDKNGDLLLGIVIT